MTLTRHGAATAPEEQSCTGPLATHVEGFAAQLSHEGYAPNTVRAKCAVLADLSRWLERRQLTLAALDEGRLRQFQATHRRWNKVHRGDPATGQQLLEYLRDRNDIAAAAQRIDRTAAACLTRDFEAFQRAGLDPEFKGAHLLRHSLATNLLRRGASLGEIGQLLRHRQPTTTQIYAKVDIAALRGIALRWPRGAS